MPLTQVSAGLLDTQASAQGFRNRLINGDMRVNQRNAVTTIDGTNSTYSVDRWAGADATDGVFTLQQSSTAPTGFVNSLLATITTADASLGATQRSLIIQYIEGNNIADLGWGTVNAQSVTLSFWVRCSLTGTFGAALLNSAEDRSYPFNYTISAANTWEYKTVTIPGDTTGTWLTTNGIGIGVHFNLGTGSTYSGTANAWAATRYYTPTGAQSVIGTLNATFYITGVQLEKGTVATDFERLDYGRQLIQCQRYCYVIGGTAAYEGAGYGFAIGSTVVNIIAWAPVEMRAQPSSTQVGTWQVSNGSTAFSASGFGVQGAICGKQSIALGITTSGVSAGAIYRIETTSTSARMILSAEL